MNPSPDPPTTPTHLVVHYHRRYHDYHSWTLTLTNATYAQPVNNARTSYGAIFRIPFPLPDSITLLPTHPNLVDAPPRHCHLPSLTALHRELHVFLLQAHPHALPSPSLLQAHPNPRLFALSISHPHAWLVVYVRHTKRDVFPATAHYRHHHHPPLFLLDTTTLAEQVTVTVQHHYNRPAPATPQHSYPAFRAPYPSHVTLSANPLTAQQAPRDLFAVITTQALQGRFLSPRVRNPPVLPSPLTRTPKYTHLVLFYYRLDRSTPIVSITVSASVKLEARNNFV